MRIIDRLIELQEKLENTQLSLQESMYKHSLNEEEKKGRQHLQDWAGEKPEKQIILYPNAPWTILVKEDLQYYRNRRLLNQSRIANRKMRYTKSATPNVKRSKEVEP